jgi:hypothetical protein
MSGDRYLGGHTLVPWHWKTRSPRTLSPADLRKLRKLDKLREAYKRQYAQLSALIDELAQERLAGSDLSKLSKRERRRVVNAARRSVLQDIETKKRNA